MIRRKRDGETLASDDLRAFLAGVTDGSIPDYQTSAMLMAIFFRGLSPDELSAWADGMLRSGDVLDLSKVARRKVDKHSTGGVGDKISLPLAPAVAACGVAVPMVSGRGLGHTGGTLDKLEPIPGFRVDLGEMTSSPGSSPTLGACLIGQTDAIAPADRKLYALRDVTATVEFISLICVVHHVEEARRGDRRAGASTKGRIGRVHEDRSSALGELARFIQGSVAPPASRSRALVISDMSQLIGRAVGNALEVVEPIEILRGKGLADTRALTIALGAEMLALGGAAEGPRGSPGALDDGSALEKFRHIVAAQGGDPRVCDDPRRSLPQACARART